MMKERGGGDVSTVATHHDSSSSPTPLPTTASSSSLLSSSSGSNSSMIGEMGGSRVAVKPCKVGGVEVTLTIAPPASGLSLSTVLKLLVAHGMSIHICSSLKLNHTILHTIHAQVLGCSTWRRIDGKRTRGVGDGRVTTRIGTGSDGVKGGAFSGERRKSD
ncbi:unnamed protein product [Cuscuta epithymum]|uniref:Uncharacterized protein n=1 Tax=Cuscuta epithymum TaxID=186058 RepID=A0AAV0DIP9_9ASTE|nr:unnamed protein product [Cuscuta epithymum]